MPPHRYVYMNYAQQECYLCASRDFRGNYPRRTGKTHGILAPFMHRVQKSMPRGGGIFLGNNRKQVMARTMPAVTSSFNSMWGLHEGENYVFGKPPAKLNYPDPIIKPRDWSNTFSFANGFVWSLVSLAVVGSANGLTTNCIAGDEAKFWSKEKLDSEVMPTLSGIIHPYGDEAFSSHNPFYKSTCFVSDASLSSRGNWLEREREKEDIVIENGPNKGRTSKQLKEELLQYARRVIDFNEVTYHARKTGHKVLVRDPLTIARARELRELCRNRAGKFHILPNGDNSETNCKVLVTFGVLTEADAELLFNVDYMVTEEDFMYYRLVSSSPKYQDHLRQLRCDCFGYWQGSTIDNISLLTEDYIKKCKRDLPPLIFAISILGIKVKRSAEGFYFALDIEGKHGYLDEGDNGIIDNNFSVKTVSRVYNGKSYSAEVETPDFERIASISDCQMDGDLHPDDELFIAGDWNSRINWLVIGTVRRNPDTHLETLYVINSMFVKGEEKVDSLMKKFNRYYAPHRRQNRVITFFYDATAKHKGYALEGQEDFKDVVIRYLQDDHWDVRPIDMGKQMAHSAKYQDINNGLAGISYPAVRINKEKNEALIVSLENAGVKQGYNGFEKDKTGEKLPYNPDLDEGSTAGGRVSATGRPTNIREEYRTDGSDAFDSLYIGVKYFRYSSAGVFACV